MTRSHASTNRFAVLMAIASTPGLALAADAEAGADPIGGFNTGIIPGIMTLVAFSVVLAGMYIMVWPKITKGLDEREAKIRDEIASAEAARKQAKDALDEYEKNLSEARAESNRMLEETKSKQQALAAELKVKADAELTEMRERAKRDIDNAKKAAINELYAESVNLATTMAGKILAREVSVNDQERLVEDSLRELQGARG